MMETWKPVNELGRPLRPGDEVTYSTWGPAYTITVGFMLGNTLHIPACEWFIDPKDSNWLVKMQSGDYPQWKGEVEHTKDHARKLFVVPATNEKDAKRVALEQFGPNHKVLWVEKINVPKR